MHNNETTEANKKVDAAHSDVSEDEFKSPTYAAGSGSESESESGSDSDSESAAASDSGSASGSESSASESESGSGSEDNSDSSDSDASGSRRKELEKKKKDFKMVLTQVSTLYLWLENDGHDVVIIGGEIDNYVIFLKEINCFHYVGRGFKGFKTVTKLL